MNELGGEIRCSTCGERFVCGSAAGLTSCWCAKLPHLMPCTSKDEGAGKGTGCMCPKCLAGALREATAGAALAAQEAAL